ncbi:hemophore-related protein [Nocardia terpenica]|uniref:Hemophore-related protein n=2 Tax=Nocardia terpenica TaxID=455432 RepID=A0A6G9YUG1_9NOCA|nr:hemophore-related protein [Nocardia terpenica]
MRMINGRHALAALALGGFAAGSTLLGSGIATADAIDDIVPLMTTTCTFEQIDKALHVVDPAVAQRLEQNPANKAVLQFMINEPAQIRQTAGEQIINGRMRMKSMTGVAPELGGFKSEMGPALGKVTAVCHKY